MAKRRGVTVTGWVPDARPYLDRAEVFVAPLMGRGVQNKLLEALAMGLSCVASMAARRGTVVADDEGMLATDEPMEFARHVAGLLQDGTRRAEMSRKARAAAEANYRWEVQLARLDQVIAAISRCPGRRRLSPASHDRLKSGATYWSPAKSFTPNPYAPIYPAEPIMPRLLPLWFCRGSLEQEPPREAIGTRGTCLCAMGNSQVGDHTRSPAFGCAPSLVLPADPDI